MHLGLKLMGVYVVVAVCLQFAAYGFGSIVERTFPEIGLVAFLTVCLSAFMIAWPIAVYLTRPKKLGDAA